MRITLETFRLLNPKIGQLERSTGGIPEVTYQEIADCLSRCSLLCSMYARWNYALDNTYQRRLVEAITDRMVTEDRKRKRPLLMHKQHWRSVTEMTLETYRGAVWLTRHQKKIVADVTRWTKRHEEAHQNVRSLLDEWDYELRSELGLWNRAQTEHGYA